MKILIDYHTVHELYVLSYFHNQHYDTQILLEDHLYGLHCVVHSWRQIHDYVIYNFLTHNLIAVQIFSRSPLNVEHYHFFLIQTYFQDEISVETMYYLGNWRFCKVANKISPVCTRRTIF
eukprot:UN21455